MKTKTTLKVLLSVIILLIASTNFTKAQNNGDNGNNGNNNNGNGNNNNWNNGNNNGNGNNNNGNNSNNNGNNCKWHNTQHDTVYINTPALINNTLTVKGKITGDSMHIYGPVHIGDSSLVLG